MYDKSWQPYVLHQPNFLFTNYNFGSLFSSLYCECIIIQLLVELGSALTT